MRTTLFMVLLLVAPITVALPFMPNLSSASTTIYTSSEQQILTYSSATTHTYYGSKTGTALVQAPLDLSPKVVGFMAPKGKCSQYTYPVTLSSGATLNMAITSTHAANVYLLPTYAYQTSADGCDLTLPTPALTFQANFTAYTLRWTAPESGTFYIILTGPTTVIMLTDVGSSQPVNELTNVTYAMSTQTSFQDYAFTSLDAVTYTTTSNPPLSTQPQTVPRPDPLTLLTLVACIGAAVIVALLRMRKS